MFSLIKIKRNKKTFSLFCYASYYIILKYAYAFATRRYSIGAQFFLISLSSIKPSSFFLEAKITKGTMTVNIIEKIRSSVELLVEKER